MFPTISTIPASHSFVFRRLTIWRPVPSAAFSSSISAPPAWLALCVSFRTIVANAGAVNGKDTFLADRWGSCYSPRRDLVSICMCPDASCRWRRSFPDDEMSLSIVCGCVYRSGIISCPSHLPIHIPPTTATQSPRFTMSPACLQRLKNIATCLSANCHRRRHCNVRLSARQATFSLCHSIRLRCGTVGAILGCPPHKKRDVPKTAPLPAAVLPMYEFSSCSGMTCRVDQAIGGILMEHLAGVLGYSCGLRQKPTNRS